MALVVKNLPANAGDIRNAGLILGSERSPGEHGNPPQYSCLENPMDRGAWQTTVQFSSVTQLCLTLCNPMDCRTPGFPLHHQTPGACSNSGPSSCWCHPVISSSAIPFYSCLQSFPASRSFPRSQLSASGGQSIGALASVLSINIQGWFPLELTGLIFLQSKGLSRVFSNTTVQKHRFFSTQLSL